MGGTTNSDTLSGSAPPGATGITVDKSVEFTYEELATATNDFSLANKIGQGGFGVVYYGELRGEVCVLHDHIHFFFAVTFSSLVGMLTKSQRTKFTLRIVFI